MSSRVLSGSTYSHTCTRYCTRCCYPRCAHLHAQSIDAWVLLQSIEDWIQDFKQFLSDAPYSTVLEEMYPDAHVHHGFLQQLQAVTDKAPNISVNIGNVLMNMSGGVPPSLVIVTGGLYTLLSPPLLGGSSLNLC